MPKAIMDADFETHVLRAEVPVLLDFWAPWCGPCKAMLPIIEELEKDYAGKAKMLKMNVDENMDTPQKFNIASIPTFVIFKGGKPVKSFIGARSKLDIAKDLDSILGS